MERATVHRGIRGERSHRREQYRQGKDPSFPGFQSIVSQEPPECVSAPNRHQGPERDRSVRRPSSRLFGAGMLGAPGVEALAEWQRGVQRLSPSPPSAPASNASISLSARSQPIEGRVQPC